MKIALILYLITLAIFLPIDLLWLGFVARDFYRDSLGPLMADRLRMDIGLLFYVVFVAGLVYFGMREAMAGNDWRLALRQGALFGFFAYATYDLTNLATLKGYPMTLALADMAWGTLLSGVSAALAVAVGHAVFGDLAGG